MKPGATAIVQSSARTFLARAAYNSRRRSAPACGRCDEAQPIDHALIKRRVKAALEKSAPAAAKAKPGQVVGASTPRRTACPACWSMRTAARTAT